MMKEDRMIRLMRVSLLIAFCLIVVAGTMLVGCSNGEAALEMPEMTFIQYVKGSTVDFDDATLNQISEGGGEAGYKYGLASALYPTYRYSTAVRDGMAVAQFGSPYKVGDASSNTTYGQLTSGDQLAVDGAIFATALTAAEQDVVVLAVDGFFLRVDADMAAEKAPSDTSAYVILTGGASQTAADAWASEVSDNKSVYADRFFVHLVKQFVTALPTAFEPFWLALGYTEVPASPSETEIELVAGIAGQTSFVTGTAGAMYPTQQEEQAQTLYGKSYAELSIMEAPYADAAVYENLPSAFGSDNMSDIVRLATRDGVAAGLKAYGMITADNYTAASGVEKARIDQAVFATALPGPALERDYVDFAAVPGAILGWEAEMEEALPLQGNIAYLTLDSQVTTTAANHWVTDVENGVHPKQAFYRWLSKEQVSQSASMAPSIQQSEGEFYIRVKNPNSYEISIDTLTLAFRIEAGTANELVDAARQTLQNIWIPANEEVDIKVSATTNTVNVISWLAAAGTDVNTARSLAGDVWTKIQQEPAVPVAWSISAQAVVSHDDEIKNQDYTL
jgi:hypothetical protein